jgi:uncharacterized protein
MEGGMLEPMIDRIAPTRRPSETPTGEQRWRELFFLHWALEPERVASRLPPGVALDCWEGQAYVGLVPFVMRDIRPSWLPRALAMDFLETNLRTYVVVNGEPGVWFFSLEASSWLAVQAARIGWGLPYHYAAMHTAREGARIRYTSRRRGAEASLALDASIGEPLGPSAPGTLEHFLLERYLLFSEKGRRLWRGQVHHSPYPAQRATVHAVSTTLLEAAGLPPASGAPLAHYAEGVDVEVFGPHPLR